MYNNLGIHWASSIPAFLALACVPFPFLFYKYGPNIRRNCKYAREAAETMAELQRRDPADMKDSDIVSEKGLEKAEPDLEPEGVRAARPDADTASAREKERKISDPDRDVEKAEL